MAQTKIQIGVDVDGNANKQLGKVEAEVARLKRQLGQLDKATKKSLPATKKLKRQFGKLQKQAGRTRAGFSKMQGALVGLGAIFAGGMLVDGVKDAAAFEAKLASLGDNVDETRARLLELQRASGGAFSMEALVTAQSKIKAFGLDLKITPKLLEVITAKASRMGISTEHAMDSFVTGVARASTPILDNLGLIVKAGAAQDSYAASIGKTRNELTDLEKSLAFQAEAMRQVNSDTTKANQAFLDSQRMTATLDDAMTTLKSSLLPLAPALVQTVQMLAEAAVHLGNFTGFMLQALGLMDDAIDKRIELTKAERITDVSIQRRFFLEKELQRLGIDSIEAFRKLEQSKQDEIKKTAKEREREILLIKNTQGHERATLALEKAGFTARDKNRILVQLGREINNRQVILKIQKEQAEQARKVADAAKSTADWMSGIAKSGAMKMFAVPAKQGKTKSTGPTGPTRKEKALDLQILGQELLLQGDVSVLERMRIENKIKQLELDKLSADRQRDEKGVLELKQKILDASSAKRIADHLKKVNEEASLETMRAAQRSALEEDKKIKHALSLEIFDLEVALARATSEEQTIAIQRQIEDLGLRKEKIGVIGRELELLVEKGKVTEANRKKEDTEKQISNFRQLAMGASEAAASLQSMSPEMANVLNQISNVSQVADEAGMSSVKTADAMLKGGASAALGFVDDEQTKAGISAAMEGARAIAAYATGNIAGGISHTLAAGMFAKIAGEGGSAAPAKPPVQRDPGGGGNITVAFGSGVVLGTAQDVGRAIYDAQGAAGKTGMVTGKV